VTMLLAPISTRNQLTGLLIPTPHPIGVEVGTHLGYYAEVLLSNWGGTLICVDHWAIPWGYEEQAELLKTIDGNEDREQDFLSATKRLTRFGPRCQIRRATSVEAAQAISDESLEFVYLDGDHSKKGIETDLVTWWGKVRPGGILAGHDFLCPGERDGSWGQFIQPVVLSFFDNLGLNLFLIVEEDNLPWSFYVRKPIP
jgi:hypothetical protein